MKAILKIFFIIPVFLCLSTVYADYFEYTADVFPWNDGWEKHFGDSSYATLTTDGGRNVLHMNDTGSSFLFTHRPWDVVPTSWYNSATFVVKGVSCSGQLGSYFGIQSRHTDGSLYNAFYVLYSDRIHPFRGEASDYMLDTTAAYNTYSIVLHEGISSLWINGALAFSHAAIPSLHDFPRNGVEFGAGSSATTGEAYWDYVSANQYESPEPVPEPSMFMLLTTGLGGLVCVFGYQRTKRR